MLFLNKVFENVEVKIRWDLKILTCEVTTCGNGTAAKIKHQDIINDMPCYTSLHPPPPLLFINNIILFSFFQDSIFYL